MDIYHVKRKDNHLIIRRENNRDDWQLFSQKL